MALLKFDQDCIDLLLLLPRFHSRVCFESALHHLDCARKIINIDPAMAKFRALTAEEEAASGLMYCLKEMRFINSERLDPKDHKCKNGIIPFFEIIRMFFGEERYSIIQEPKLYVMEGDKKRLRFEFKMIVDDKPYWFYPEPPLNVGIVNKGGSPESFENQINSFSDLHGVKKVFEYIKKQANIRNELLYAGPNGYPKDIKFNDSNFLIKRKNVFSLLKVYLLIRPYKKSELWFVQNALDCYLKILSNR